MNWAQVFGIGGGSANSLKSSTTDIQISTAAAPSAGQVLTADSPTAASWKTTTADGATTPLNESVTLTQAMNGLTFRCTVADIVITIPAGLVNFGFAVQPFETGVTTLTPGVGVLLDDSNASQNRSRSAGRYIAVFSEGTDKYGSTGL